MKASHALRFLVAFAAAHLPAMSASAAPVSGEQFSLRQPDGATVDVRIWGDEYYRVVESLDGYTLVKDPATGVVCYAKLSEDGHALASTGIRAGDSLPAMVKTATALRNLGQNGFETFIGPGSVSLSDDIPSRESRVSGACKPGRRGAAGSDICWSHPANVRPSLDAV